MTSVEPTSSATTPVPTVATTVSISAEPATVTELRFDHAFTVVMDAKVVLRIETPFRFIVPGRLPVMIDPEDIPRDGVPTTLFGLLHATVESLTYTDGGAIEVVVAGGRRITVEPSTQYEAWSLSGPGNALVVSTLDGEVSEWSDTTGRASS